MVNAEILQGQWTEIKGKLQKRWGQLTDDTLQQVHGDIGQLAGLIERQTGESRQEVERVLEEITSGASSAVASATSTAKRYAQQAVDAVGSTGRQAADQLRAGYNQAEATIQERPVESLAVCFAAGMITGVLVTLMLRSK